MPEKCQAIARSGKPCGATVVADGMCAWHAPSWAAKRAEWSSRGGSARSNAAKAKKSLPVQPMTNAEVLAWLGVAFRRVLTNQMTPGTATALASLSRAMLDLARTVDLEE